MTTDPTPRPRPRRRRPRPHAVVGSALALFLAVLALLAWQLRSGHDPAIGAGPALAQVTQARQPVVVRKIVKRVVIVRASGEADDDGGSAPTTTVSTQSAGAAQPAPAPAPLTTRAS